MKRYLLFMWNYSDVSGGWNDLQDSYDTLEEPVEIAKQFKDINYYHIVDSTIGKIVKES